MNRPSEKARALAHTTEALCIASTAKSGLREAVRRCVELDAALTRIEIELVQANRQISGPEYVAERVPA